MDRLPLVSAIIIFFNAERFLAEAIESVLNQKYTHWELLLVDDGSTDNSRSIADRYAAVDSERVRVLAHPGNENRGMAASRNLGIAQASGDYVAFLDADDVWLGSKLKEQVAILQAHGQVGMLYGQTLYWYGWTQEPQDIRRDFIPALRAPLCTPVEPPLLLPLFLRGEAAVPCTCSILVRRSLLDHIGGFEASFARVNSLYEDQAFYAKVCLNAAVIASDTCWDLYRQHPEASTAVARESGQEAAARAYFLCWLEAYMTQRGVEDATAWMALRRELWRQRLPAWMPAHWRVQSGARWIKKWLLRIEERLLPAPISARLWRKPLS